MRNLDTEFIELPERQVVRPKVKTMPGGEKKILLLIAFVICSIPTNAREHPDSFTCIANQKAEIKGKEEITQPWQTRDIPVAFNYDKNHINIYAKETLTLTIGKVGPHYDNKEGQNSIDMEAVDQRGLRCMATFILLKDNNQMLVVRYREVVLRYKLKRLSKPVGTI